MTESLSRNTNSSFVGIAELKRKQAEQLATFEQWAARGDWQAIHRDHFDWCMFPIDETNKFGTTYTVYAGDIAELKQDAAYVRSYLRGLDRLLALNHERYAEEVRQGLHDKGAKKAAGKGKRGKSAVDGVEQGELF